MKLRPKKNLIIVNQIFRIRRIFLIYHWNSANIVKVPHKNDVIIILRLILLYTIEYRPRLTPTIHYQSPSNLLSCTQERGIH